MRFVIHAAMLATVGLLVGCGGDVSRVPVRGKVFLDGQLIETGQVEFIPADGASPSANGGIIANGEYTAEVPAGDVIVKIRSSKVTGKHKVYDSPDSPTVDILEERIPKKYNEDTILKESIRQGQPPLDFQLSTK